MSTANPKNSYQAAVQRVQSMDNGHLRCVWNAIQQGGLSDLEPSERVNGVSKDDWVTIVYREMDSRGFST